MDRRTLLTAVKRGVLAVLLLGFACHSALAQTAVERAKKDELTWVPKDDPAMERAFAKARGTLDDFLRIAKTAPPHLRGFALKVGIRDGDKVEYFWLSGFAQDGDRFSGLITNAPRAVRSVRYGQRYDFTRADIFDWVYVDSSTRRMHGNFTACALLSREPPEQAAEFRRQYGLDCE